MTMRRCLLFAAAALILSGSAWAEPDLDSQIKAQQDELDRVSRMTQFHQTEIQTVRQQQKTYSGQLEQLDQKMAVSRQKINLLSLQIRKNDEETKRLSQEIVQRTGRIEELQKLLNERLVAIYKYGTVADYNLLLSASSAVELGSITYMLGRIAQSDQAMITELASERKKLSEDKTALETNRAQLEGRRKALATEESQARKDAQAKQSVMAQLEQNEKAHQAALEELKNNHLALQRTIDRLLAQKAEEARRRQTEGRPAMPTVVHKGKLAWPLDSHRISSPFGPRIHPKFKTRSMHTGIDLPAPKGTPVKAAGDGVVLYAGWIRGYGQIVILDHGNQMSTVYAHLSAITVQEGAKVSAGSTVGRVGSSGVATATHLHFEVRIGGTAKNPVDYLPK